MTQDDQDDLELRAITARRMARYPHAAVAPTTVDAFVKGYWRVLDVSNARPAAYASEPWTWQSAAYHCAHAVEHVAAARSYFEGYGGKWLDHSDAAPNLAHAAARCFFAMVQHDRGQS
jgi:hypothetical protein